MCILPHSDASKMFGSFKPDRSVFAILKTAFRSRSPSPIYTVSLQQHIPFVVSMSGQSGKRKASSGADNSSPTKKHNPGKAKHTATTPPSQHNPSEATASTSPPKLPKTLHGSSKFGFPKNTAKSLMKHGSEPGALYSMLYGFAGIIWDKKPETKEKIKSLLDELVAQLDPAPFEKRTFSAISKDEFDDMCRELNLTASGTIVFADTQTLLRDVTIPESFKEQADLVRKINLSGTEAGCRLNIGLYLANAVYLARKYLNAGEIGLFSEVPFEHQDLPGIGHIGGSLDYLTSAYAGVKGPGKLKKALVRLETPYLLVVDAKTTSSIGKDSSLYQLIAQLITVDHHDPSDEGRWGCLTTGSNWEFYYLRKKMEEDFEGENIITGYDLFELSDVNSNGEEGMLKVMGILIHIVGRFSPSESDTVMLEDNEEEDWEGIVTD